MTANVKMLLSFTFRYRSYLLVIGAYAFGYSRLCQTFKPFSFRFLIFQIMTKVFFVATVFASRSNIGVTFRRRRCVRLCRQQCLPSAFSSVTQSIYHDIVSATAVLLAGQSLPFTYTTRSVEIAKLTSAPFLTH